MAGTDDDPDLFDDGPAGVGRGSGEGTAQPGGDRDGADVSDAPEEDEGAAAPGGDAPIAAASSVVGRRDAGDTSDIGSTNGMTASTGGMAGTSR